MAKGIHQSLRIPVEGKALNIVKSVRDGNGFEVWRRLWAEYRPNVAGRKTSLLENVMSLAKNFRHGTMLGSRTLGKLRRHAASQSMTISNAPLPYAVYQKTSVTI